ncbi:MAG: nucleotidyltransferase domain-containing protein [Nitrospinae bacterium]|nr:nucleotidyltransferase domain-containing protein [Nitrospinota bacterium]
MNHGLSDRQLMVLKEILSLYAEEIASVDLFGSRATGDYRPNSDVDLVVRGTIKEKQIDRLWPMFHESNLPFSVDVKSYELTTYPPLKAHIDKVCKPLFTRQDLIAVTGKSEISGV